MASASSFCPVDESILDLASSAPAGTVWESASDDVRLGFDCLFGHLNVRVVVDSDACSRDAERAVTRSEWQQGMSAPLLPPMAQ